jgi:hypothetical protein
MAALSPTNDELVFRAPMPVYKEAKETKSGGFQTHIDTQELYRMLSLLKKSYGDLETRVKVVYERPMINPRRWVATESAIRADEALRIVLREHQFARVRVDSRNWQSVFCPGAKGPDLKKASRDAAMRLFPAWQTELEKADDGDAILIAEYGRRNNL